MENLFFRGKMVLMGYQVYKVKLENPRKFRLVYY